MENAESVRSVVTEKGASLVQYVLQGIAGAAPRSYLNLFSNVLSAMNTHCVSLLSQWLEVRIMCTCIALNCWVCAPYRYVSTILSKHEVFYSVSVQDLLAQDGFPTHHVSVVEKQQFKSTVLR